MENNGKVWLVGAGPGSGELLTAKAQTVLEKADVVIYDALIQLEILTKIPTQAKKIYVGKRAGHHSASQQQINEILLQEALKGKQVVRLKGGDPFVFGRGAEELEGLAAHQIPFEVVPGITSAIAVLEYAGIPVTHRGIAPSFHVITGHRSEEAKQPINYHALAQLDGTLIFLMGRAAVKEISEKLIKEGMHPDTPAAAVSFGTTKRQKVTISTLKNLEFDCERMNIQTPAIIAVGQVCTQKFEWINQLPLFQKQVVVTREKRYAEGFVKKLEEKGAHVITFPTIETVPLKDTTAFRQTMNRLTEPNEKASIGNQWIVLTSPTGVEYFFSLLRKENIDLRKLLLEKKKFAVCGSGTAAALEQHGIYADVIPERFSGKELGRMLQKEVNKNDGIYLFRSALADEELPMMLKEAGLSYEEVSIYETVFCADSEWSDLIWDQLEQNQIDAVMFTSASTVKGFAKAMGERDFSIVPALCIGKKTALEASSYHMHVTISKQAALDSMIDQLLESEIR